MYLAKLVPLVLPLLLGILSAAPQAGAQSGSSTAASTTMRNSDVMALVGAGLSDEIVIAKIQTAPSTAFDTNVDGLTALKKASVSPAVIRAMIDPHPVAAAVSPSAAGLPTTPAGDPDDPNSVHSPGVYVLTPGTDGRNHMTKLETEKPRGAKNSGVLAHALTYGLATAKAQQVIDGAKAPVELSQARPVFYAYFPEYNGSFVGGISVNDLVLTRLEVRGDTRLWTYAAHGLFGGSSEIGSDQKDRQGFTSEQMKPGIYKLTPTADLPAGQYAFKYSAFYMDFGIQSPS